MTSGFGSQASFERSSTQVGDHLRKYARVANMVSQPHRLYPGGRVDSASSHKKGTGPIPTTYNKQTMKSTMTMGEMGKVRTQEKCHCGLSGKPAMGMNPLSSHYPDVVQR